MRVCLSVFCAAFLAALLCNGAFGQGAGKLSEQDLDAEDQDFAALDLDHGSTSSKGKEASHAAVFDVAPRFKESAEGLVDRCEKLYWNALEGSTSEKPIGGFFPGMTVGKVMGNEKILFVADLHQEKPATMYRLDTTANQSWSKVVSTGTAPETADGVAGAKKDGKIVFFGGKQGESFTNDVRAVELSSGGAAWLTLQIDSPEKPEGRMGASLTAMTAGNSFFMFGGYSDAKDFDDTFLLIPSGEPTANDGGLSLTWKKMRDTGAKPPKRSGHSASLFKAKKSENEKFVVFGGCAMNAAECYNDVWVFTAGPLEKWDKMETTGAAPKKRSQHTAFIVGNKLYVYGGLDGMDKTKPLGDLYVLDLVSKVWSSPTESQYGTNTQAAPFKGGDVVQQFNNFVIVQAADATVQTLRVDGVCSNDCKKTDTGATVTDKGDCKCSASFEGKYCADKKTNATAATVSCPSGCSGNGECVEGKCKCEIGFGSDDCSVEVCPENCNHHGSCVKGKCHCDDFHHGDKCQFTFCPGKLKKCNGNGVCNKLLGRCDCKPGFGGSGCKKVNLCPNNCTDNGECVTTKATAKMFSTSKCACFPGFKGLNCSLDTRCFTETNTNCGGHGKCDNMKCKCDAGWTGDDCTKKACPKNCNNNGDCDALLGKCKCNAGFIGELCETRVRCVKNCSMNGVCVHDAEGTNGLPDYDGICKCNNGFSGADCSEKQCPLGSPNQFAKGKEECSGDIHGSCDSKTGVCSCHPGFGGFACEFSCPAGRPSHAGKFSNASGAVPTIGLGHGSCSGHGLCVTSADGKARCQCEAGLSGEACDVEAKCESDCNGNGKCFRGECVCEIGFKGTLCETKLECPQATDGRKCSGHGQCQHGNCFCDVGWRGDGCGDRILCRENCNGHGRCHDSKCFCAVGYTGSACEIQKSCANKCSGHGRCFLDDCICEVGYSGKDCSAEDKKLSPSCRNDCSGNGQCRLGKCFCLPSYKGEDCSVPVDYQCAGGMAKETCSGKGVCKYNKCFCMPGFTGDDCSKIAKCPKDCSGNGICKNGRCYCRPPFRGVDCNGTDACPNGCSERGICMKGKCLCVEGFGGKDCSQVTGNMELCPDDCSGHGSCALGKCFCDPGWGGKGCGTKKRITCPENCNQQGLCHSDGKCYCNPGLGGRDCSTPMPCPTGCTQHGICKYGKCFCQPGYMGSNCSTPINAETRAALAAAKTKFKSSKVCPNQCSHNGFCLEGKCLCQPGYDGVDCSRVIIGNEDCPNDCGGKENPKGICWLGKCFCFPGFAGADCLENVKLPCTNGCNDRGQCHFGKCFCDIGFVGEACETEVKTCPNDCMGRGQCSRGRCVCEIGFRGMNCNITVGTALKCQDNCNNRGACIMGQCQCTPGFIGASCQTALGQVKNVKGNAKLSDQDAVLAAVHNPDHIPSTDVAMPDSDYIGVPQDVVVSHNKSSLTSGQKKSVPVKPLKLDGDSEQVKEKAAEKKDKVARRSRNKNVGQNQQTMRMMFLESDEGAENEKCSSNGEFRNGKCFCFPGFKGEFCDAALECPSKCSSQGICSRGKCFCNPGFEGEDCSAASTTAKPNTAKTGESGCPNGCSHNGICQANKCWCKDGFMGANCAEVVDLAAAASSNHGTNSDMLASAPLIPMNFMVVVGVAAFVLGLVGAMWRQRKHEREMALRQASPHMKTPLFK